MKTLFYVSRVAGTGLSFAVFGIGGVLIALSLFLLQSLRLIPASKLQHHSRKAITAAFRIYIQFMRCIGLLTYEVHGKQQLEQLKGHLIIANHPSLLDVVFIGSLLEQSNCIVKAGLLENPFTKPPITACNFINNQDEYMVENAAKALIADENLIIFPEGTRTIPGEKMKFLRGAANIALQANADILPITIRCKPDNLLKDKKWYQIPPSPPHYTINIHPPLQIEQHLDTEKMPSQQARKLTKLMQKTIEQYLGAQAAV